MIGINEIFQPYQLDEIRINQDMDTGISLSL